MLHGRHLEKSKNVVLMDIINSLLKTGNKTANIDVKNCSLYIGYVNAVNIAFLWFLRFLICRR